MNERLQKLIARAGIASRRRAEDLIVSGQVEVNGKVVTELGAKADPEHDVIRVAGRRLRFPERPVFLALNKPDACVSALTDPEGRPTLREFLHGVSGRVYPVGGLEYHSTGLVLLTSDGAFAERLFRALGRGLPQTYQVKVKNPLSREQMETIARRIGPIRISRSGPNPWYEARLAGESKERLRKLLLELGHPVEKLKRVAIGRIELGDLEPGRWRNLSETDLRGLDQDLKRPFRATRRPEARAVAGAPETVSYPAPARPGRRRPPRPLGPGRRKRPSAKPMGRRENRAGATGAGKHPPDKRRGRKFHRKGKSA
jgi:23S rRNA pseudouridine2605 synthase